MTRMTVTDENEIAKGTRLGFGLSPKELLEPSIRGDIEGGGKGVADRDAEGMEKSGFEKAMARRSSASLP